MSSGDLESAPGHDEQDQAPPPAGLISVHHYGNPAGVTAGNLWHILGSHFEENGSGDASSSKAQVLVRVGEDDCLLTSVEISGEKVTLHWAAAAAPGEAAAAFDPHA